jgi:uncharacterized repeat protein (TIGR03803 family)
LVTAFCDGRLRAFLLAAASGSFTKIQVPMEGSVVSTAGSKAISTVRQRVCAVFFIAILALVGLVSSASAQTFSMIYGFTGAGDGMFLQGPLVLDSAGDVYGATRWGGLPVVGSNGYGTVFKVAPNGSQTVLHAFNGTDGQEPLWVTLDPSGTVYGLADFGGPAGGGAAFKIDTQGNYTTLHSFLGAPDGKYPRALVEDSAGNLYGSTYWGGTATNCGSGCGTLFKIDNQGNYSVLYSFTGGNDGSFPWGSLALDAAGNLYGAARNGGGAGANGTTFKFNLASGVLTILHSYSVYNDGECPMGVVLDASGNLWGVTTVYGHHDAGTLYEIPAAGGFRNFHDFTGGADGGIGLGGANLALDATGNIYGTASRGGSSTSYQGCYDMNGCGLVFKFGPGGKETVLHNFTGFADGGVPVGIALDGNGHVYGAAAVGGPFATEPTDNLLNGGGTVVKITLKR